MDIEPDIVIPSEPTISGVEADAHPHDAVWRPIETGQLALGRGRGGDCRAGGPKHSEERVSFGPDDPAIVGLEAGSQQMVVVFDDAAESLVADTLYQAGGTFDVRKEKGDRTRW